MPAAISEAFLDGETARDIRIRLVQKSQEGVQTLRIVPPSLNHQSVGHLLRDVTRLSFENVEICGDGSGLEKVPDVDLRRLRRRVSRFDIALFGPDSLRHDQRIGREGSFAESLKTVQRLKTFARIQAGSYGILSDGTELVDYQIAWEEEKLPGKPAFRLAGAGGDLSALAQSVQSLPEGATKAAITAHVPPCLLGSEATVDPVESWEKIHGEVLENADPHTTDRIGQFNSCILSAECRMSHMCPGIAMNWTSDHIKPVKA